jgi:hypothetical protein
MRKVCNQGHSACGFSWSVHHANGRSPVPAPPFSAARRAVSFDRGGVDRQRYAVLAAAGEHLEDRLPMSALGPAIETIVDRCVRTIVGRAIAPACAALKHVNDTADNASIADICTQLFELAPNIDHELDDILAVFPRQLKSRGSWSSERRGSLLGYRE